MLAAALFIFIKMQLPINITLRRSGSKDEVFVILWTNSCQRPYVWLDKTPGPMRMHNCALSVLRSAATVEAPLVGLHQPQQHGEAESQFSCRHSPACLADSDSAEGGEVHIWSARATEVKVGRCYSVILEYSNQDPPVWIWQSKTGAKEMPPAMEYIF